MSVERFINASHEMMTEGRDVPWLMQEWVRREPDKTFLVWEPFTGASRRWTYAQINRDIEALAGALHQRGVKQGERVLVHMDNSPEFIVSWFACARIGAVVVSTNTRSVERDMRYFSEHTGAVAAITQPKFANLIAVSAPQIAFLVLTDNDAGQEPSEEQLPAHVPYGDLLENTELAPQREVDPQADLGIQFTSGTTSRPKAVLWTHANALWGAQINAQHMRLQSDDTTLVFLPLFHTNAQSYSMLGSLWMGATMVVQPRFSASRFWDVSLRNDCTWCSTIPFCVKALLSQPVPDEHSYRFWGSAVALPDADKHFRVTTFGWWGMTETITQGITADPSHPGPALCIGRPSPAYEIEIRRPDGSLIEPGERGSLFIRGVRGVSLFKEYFDNPEATAGAFDDLGWFDTGDLISMDAEGNLFFSDRDKDMLKVGAENVAASEIELVLLETGLVAECAVVGQKHSMLDEVPVAFVLPAGGAPTDLCEKLLDECRAKLADFKVPWELHIVQDFPRSTLEKIAKNELRDRLPEIEV